MTEAPPARLADEARAAKVRLSEGPRKDSSFARKEAAADEDDNRAHERCEEPRVVKERCCAARHVGRGECDSLEDPAAVLGGPCPHRTEPDILVFALGGPARFSFGPNAGELRLTPERLYLGLVREAPCEQDLIRAPPEGLLCPPRGLPEPKLVSAARALASIRRHCTITSAHILDAERFTREARAVAHGPTDSFGSGVKAHLVGPKRSLCGARLAKVHLVCKPRAKAEQLAERLRRRTSPAHPARPASPVKNPSAARILRSAHLSRLRAPRGLQRERRARPDALRAPAQHPRRA